MLPTKVLLNGCVLMSSAVSQGLVLQHVPSWIRNKTKSFKILTCVPGYLSSTGSPGTSCGTTSVVHVSLQCNEERREVGNALVPTPLDCVVRISWGQQEAAAAEELTVLEGLTAQPSRRRIQLHELLLLGAPGTGLQEANLLVRLEKAWAQTPLAEHPHDVQDRILPRFALCLAVFWLGVLRGANVGTNVVALVRSILALAIVAVRGVVVETLAAVVAAVHQRPQALKSILDVINGHLQLVNCALDGCFAVNANLDGGAADADAIEVMNHHSPTVDILGAQPGRDAEVVHSRWQSALDRVADILPRVLRDEVHVPEMAADGAGVIAARALVDVDTAAVRSSAGTAAGRVQALCE